MEGLNKEVKAYDFLASVYDELLGDEEAFEYWLKYIEEKPFKTVLELASGSGVMARILKEKGYEVMASDISDAMKEAAKANFDGPYLLLNMIDFNLNQKFDLILCICDSLNYLYEDELSTMFKTVYKHLNEGGRFIFDTHHPERLNEFKEEYIEEGYLGNLPYQWTINADQDEKTINEHFTFYTNDGMVLEQHTQNVFDLSVIEEKLKEVGFKTKMIKDFVEDEKVLFIGEK